MRKLPSQNLNLTCAICCCCYAALLLLLLVATAAASAAAAVAAAPSHAAATGIQVACAAAVCPVASQQAFVLSALRPAVNLSRPHHRQRVAKCARLGIAQVPAKHAVLCGFIVRACLQGHNSNSNARILSAPPAGQCAHAGCRGTLPAAYTSALNPVVAMALQHSLKALLKRNIPQQANMLRYPLSENTMRSKQDKTAPRRPCCSSNPS